MNGWKVMKIIILGGGWGKGEGGVVEEEALSPVNHAG